MFEDALLDFLHAVVVLLQNGLGFEEIVVALGALVPRQLHEGLQVGELHLIVGALGIHALELGKLVVESRLDFVAPCHLLGLLAQLVGVAAGVIAEFLLDVLQLTLQEVVALLLVDVHLCFLAYVAADAGVLQLQRHLAQQGHGACQRAHLAQELYLDTRVHGHVGAHKVDEEAHRRGVVEGHRHLTAVLVVELHIFLQAAEECLVDGFEVLRCHLLILLMQGLDVCDEGAR